MSYPIVKTPSRSYLRSSSSSLRSRASVILRSSECPTKDARKIGSALSLNLGRVQVPVLRPAWQGAHITTSCPLNSSNSNCYNLLGITKDREQGDRHECDSRELSLRWRQIRNHRPSIKPAELPLFAMSQTARRANGNAALLPRLNRTET